MTTIITFVVSTLACVGAVMFILAMTPILYAYAYAKNEQAKQDVSDALKIARTNKVIADQDVLESRRAKLDSEVAILELRIEEKRRKLGLDNDFKPDNY